MEAYCVLHQVGTEILNIVEVSLILDSVNQYAVMVYKEREAATALHSARRDNHTERNGKIMKLLLCPCW
jgi:hypothetical protein